MNVRMDPQGNLVPIDSPPKQGNVKLEMWKDNDGIRLLFSREQEPRETFTADLSYESAGKLICALDEYISDEPDGSYKAYFFEVSDDE